MIGLAMPQYGVITSVEGETARVHVPLYNIETEFIDSFQDLSPEMVGREALIVFVNGDLNQGVIAGVKKA